jgi:hypothetical protein
MEKNKRPAVAAGPAVVSGKSHEVSTTKEDGRGEKTPGDLLFPRHIAGAPDGRTLRSISDLSMISDYNERWLFW